MAEKGLQAHTSWLNKCIQLYETYLVRHGIMVVGPAGSGALALHLLAALLVASGAPDPLMLEWLFLPACDLVQPVQNELHC